MPVVSTIGVLGGMGPDATNRLCALITSCTRARRDQDHIPVITFNNSLIPERVGAIRGETSSPVTEIIRTARVLEEAGAQLLVMPCNLAHYFFDEVQSALRVPVLNMIEETVRFALAAYPHFDKVGLLASTPTIKTGLYERSFAVKGKVVLSPAAAEQESKVMKAIYGERGIKAGHRDEPRTLLLEAARGLVICGAELLIAGCSEVSLVLEQDCLPLPIIDPLEVLARVAIERAGARARD